MIGNRADQLIVRPYAPDEAPALSRILREAVRVTASRFYTPEQIAAWLSIAPDADRIRAIYADGRSAFVACNSNGEPVAFSDHDDAGHIFFLYCAPSAGRRGAAARLMDAVEDSARRAGIGRLDSDASEAALSFFLKRGFVHVRRQDLEIGGVGIHNHKVERQLER
ncbi:MAG: GNAT family N-acetyltransferase [Rhodobacteraceae bacterium]|jgi:putative acetyltransferase|nr:GNAT family N-acetyltransferase [Paracoccaceae bacterium]